MSTLTKVLILLQTIFAIFLCGIVVTYVANASNYKEQVDSARNQATTAKNTLRRIESEWEEYKTNQDAALAEAKEQIAALETENTTKTQALEDAKREHLALLSRVNGIAAKMESAVASADKINDNYAQSQATLDKLRGEYTRLNQEYKDTLDVLDEKLAIIASQDEKIKRLTEERSELSARLEKNIRQFGLAPSDPTAVTTVTAQARAAQPMKLIDLKGHITDLDLENALAEISIGSAAGVEQEMKFHVTRGSDYICDILVIAVDTEKAVGQLEMVKATPKVGDPITTNF